MLTLNNKAISLISQADGFCLSGVIGMRYGVPTMRREGSTPSTSTTGNYTIPGRALTRPRMLITTAEAAMTCKHIIGVLAVDHKRVHSDVPFLPERMPQIR